MVAEGKGLRYLMLLVARVYPYDAEHSGLPYVGSSP